MPVYVKKEGNIMNLEFKTFRIKQNSTWIKIMNKYNSHNEFIKVGEKTDSDKKYCEMLQLENEDKGLILFGGLKLNEIALIIPESELEPTSDDVGVDYVTLDIPKEHLTMDLIENIQRLNSMEG